MEGLKIEDLSFSCSGRFIQVLNFYDGRVLDVLDAKLLIKFLNKYIEDENRNSIKSD